MVMGFVLTRNAVVVFWVLFNFYEMVGDGLCFEANGQRCINRRLKVLIPM